MIGQIVYVSGFRPLRQYLDHETFTEFGSASSLLREPVRSAPTGPTRPEKKPAAEQTRPVVDRPDLRYPLRGYC